MDRAHVVPKPLVEVLWDLEWMFENTLKVIWSWMLIIGISGLIFH